MKSSKGLRRESKLTSKNKRELDRVLRGIRDSKQRTIPTLNPTDKLNSRRYLPTLADLVDRLTIVQQKMIFIPENATEYAKERADIEHDIDLILQTKAIVLTATDIHAICMIMLTNRFIWENESKARNGGPEQDKLLKLTHSINGVRNTAKNALARVDSGRKDYKIDALAADLPPEFGNWKVFGV